MFICCCPTSATTKLPCSYFLWLRHWSRRPRGMRRGSRLLQWFLKGDDFPTEIGLNIQWSWNLISQLQSKAFIIFKSIDTWLHLEYLGFDTQFCHNILQPSYSPFGDMVPHDTQEKKGNAILEGLQKTKQQEELLRSMRKGSNGSLLGSTKPNAMIFESEKMKQKKIFSPESHVKLAQELPNHKVSVCFHFCLLNCSLLWRNCILSQVLVDRLLNKNSVAGRLILIY